MYRDVAEAWRLALHIVAVLVVIDSVQGGRPQPDAPAPSPSVCGIALAPQAVLTLLDARSRRPWP